MTLRIRALSIIERCAKRLASYAECLAQRCAVCPICGRNRYTGAPCYGEASPEYTDQLYIERGE